MCGNEKAVLDLAYLKKVIANTPKFIWFYVERRELLRNVYNKSPADRSGSR
jgi:hypothetical protein